LVLKRVEEKQTLTVTRSQFILSECNFIEPFDKQGGVRVEEEECSLGSSLNSSTDPRGSSTKEARGG
jgi:hypothetical protein